MTAGRALEAVLLCAASAALAAAQDARLEEGLLRAALRPEEGGALYDFGRSDTIVNWAGAAGLLNERLRRPNPYLPPVRTDTALETRLDPAGHAYAVYAYTESAPDPLRAERTMTPLPGSSLMRVAWRVRNEGPRPVAIAPRSGNDLRPGGTVDARDTLVLPAAGGLAHIARDGYVIPVQGWAAATDPIERESLVALFAPGAVRAVRTRWEAVDDARSFELAFAPRTLEPGAVWTAEYALGIARGLDRVDFACDALAAQASLEQGGLSVRIAPLQPYPAVRIDAALRTPGGSRAPLESPATAFDPAQPVVLAYALTGAVLPGSVFEARLFDAEDRPIPIGVPDGRIEIPLRRDPAAPAPVTPWAADAAPRRAPRTLERPPAHRGDPLVWFEPALEKLFREDPVNPVGGPDPTAYLVLAANETESFQIALRPAARLRGVQVRADDLVHPSGAVLPASDVRLYNVEYVDLALPSYLEGAAGRYPDPLPPHTPFDAPAGENRAVWVSVYAQPGLPAGPYRGPITIAAEGRPPIELALEAYVYGFALPATPALATDVAFWPDAARAAAPQIDRETLDARYRDAALERRITLRRPAPDAGDAEWLRETEAYMAEAGRQRARGLSSLFVPPAALDTPGALERLDALAARHGLDGAAFTLLAHEPAPEGFPAIEQTAAQWRARAPHIAPAAAAAGLQLFTPAALDRWAVHLPAFQSPANPALLEAIAAGKQVWAYLDDLPGPPFANLCIDRPALEHRILGWQAFMLGLRGVHYWNAAYVRGAAVPARGADGVWRVPGIEGPGPANGDGLLMYPGPGGPIASIRLETLRDAIEDHAYAALLLAEIGGGPAPPPPLDADAAKTAGGGRKARARTQRDAPPPAYTPPAPDNLRGLAREALDLRPWMRALDRYDPSPSAWLAARIDIGDALERLRRILFN